MNCGKSTISLYVDTPPDVLFNSDNLVANGEIAENLCDMDIPNLAVRPAIFIDDKKKWHENYWFLTFTNEFDCWDRKTQNLIRKLLAICVPQTFVGSYSLNEQLLKDTPLASRLLFKLGGTMEAMVVVHQSLDALFDIGGVNLIPVDEY